MGHHAWLPSNLAQGRDLFGQKRVSIDQTRAEDQHTPATNARQFRMPDDHTAARPDGAMRFGGWRNALRLLRPTGYGVTRGLDPRVHHSSQEAFFEVGWMRGSSV
jgi:hypothetical protein